MNKKVKIVEKDLKLIAMDIFKGHIFTDRHIPVGYKGMIGQVFMPLIFMDDKERKRLKKEKAWVLYEYLSKALPRGINGMPMFMSFGYLTEDEAKTVDGYIKELTEAEKKFMGISGNEKDKVE